MGDWSQVSESPILWFLQLFYTPCFTLSWGSLCVLAPDHPLLTHQTPSLASRPHGCFRFPESVVLGSV